MRTKLNKLYWSVLISMGGGLLALPSMADVVNEGGKLGDGTEFHSADRYYGVDGNGKYTATGGKVIIRDAIEKGTQIDNVYGGSAAAYNGNMVATNNQVKIESTGQSSIKTDVLGGYAHIHETGTSSANNNTVILSGSGVSIGDDVLGGSAQVTGTGNALANNNIVTFAGGPVSVDDVVFGGYAYIKGNGDASVNYNTVTIISGSDVLIDGVVFGGEAVVEGTGTASANKNVVTFSGNQASVSEDVLGGAAYVVGTGDASANNNTIILSGNSILIGDGNGNGVFCGYADVKGTGNISVSNNVITLSGNKISIVSGILGGEGFVIGTGDASINHNTVTLSGSGISVERYILGGANFVTETGNASANNNTVILSGNDISVANYVLGGSTFVMGTGNASSNDNIVTLSGSGISIGNDVSGGEAYVYSTGSVSANNNIVTLSGSSISIGSDVYGGYARNNGSGAVSASNNTINISNGEIVGNVIGGTASVNNSGTVVANANMVTLSGNNISIGSYVLGGFAYAGTGTASTNNNIVTLSGSEVGVNENVFGGFAAVDGSGEASSNNNTVTISNGRVNRKVYGGYSYIEETGTASSNNNIVHISGGEIKSDVVGGCAKARADSDARTIANNNTVIISGNPTINGSIYGGIADNSSGNTLEIRTNNLSVENVSDFQNYRFVLPISDILSSPALILTDGSGFDISNAKIAVGIAAGTTPALTVGDEVTLIQREAKDTDSDKVKLARTANENMIPSEEYSQTSLKGLQGFSVMYDLTLDVGANNIYATVNDVSLNPSTKNFSEGRLAGFTFMRDGANLIVDQGIKAAISANAAQGGVVPFVAVDASDSRYDTGSHADVDGFSMVFGLAGKWNLNAAKLTAGAFVEGGWGDYDAYNSFANASSTKGSGDTHYTGGGLLGRVDFAQTNKGHVYTEGSIRIGYTKTDYKSNDIRNTSGLSARYEAGSTYYGAHLGVGYVWRINETSDLDTYIKYLWTHQEGKDVSVSGDRYDFDCADSHRLRLGGQYAGTIRMDNGHLIKPYVGGYYEYEFDASVGATTYGMRVKEPDLKGSTGMLELGMNWKASETSPFSLEAAIQGYTGKREGVSGRVFMKYAF